MNFIKLITFVVVFILSIGCVTVDAEEFTVPEVLLFGDVDMDGEVTVKDATAIQKGIAELSYLTSVQRYLADPDKTGVTIKNATDIQKHITDINTTSSLLGSEVDMSKKNTFSGKAKDDSEFGDWSVSFRPNPEWEFSYEYTLKDFPEYDFSSIEVKRYGDFAVFYTLNLKNPGRDNVLEAVRALDYRANIDLDTVDFNWVVYPAWE